MFGDDRVSVHDITSHYRTKWSQDEYTRGSYSYHRVGEFQIHGHVSHVTLIECSPRINHNLVEMKIGRNIAGNIGNEQAVLGMPMGKCLYFAGEHTAEVHNATTTGAYLSGLRAAQQITQHLHGMHGTGTRIDTDYF